MASKYLQNIIIEVKNGDALSNNRITGKSNTGTYFLGSSKFYDQIKLLFDNCVSFEFDRVKIMEYQTLFKKFYFEHRDNYPDKMLFFETNCEKLINSCENFTLDLVIRNNDSRYFFRFANNDNEFINEFRSILYGDISSIVLSFDGNRCFIYPIITNYDYFNNVVTFEDCE